MQILQLISKELIMTETVATYSDLITEAFITPIRNVTVIDDEYPTLLSLIDMKTVNPDTSGQSRESKSATTYTGANIERLKKIITMCQSSRKWSIDVFDGKSPNFGGHESIPGYIHHSDLIILDYHLDGDTSADEGKRARSIIQSLDNNNHYNITLVHTKGLAGDIKSVFKDILTDFIRISNDNILIPTDDIDEKINDWLDVNNDGDKYNWIREDLHLLDALSVYASMIPEERIKPQNPDNPLNHYSDEILEVAKEIGINGIDVVKWRLYDILKKNNIKFAENIRTDLKWHWCDNTNYISTGKTFISIIRKSNDNPEDELIGSLNLALTKQNASPMHLLMAKMRYELDERGIEQASKIISNRYAQAGWLYSLLQNSESDYAHDKAINLHWEQLATASRIELRDFSKKIMAVAKNLNPGNSKEFVKQFFKDCINRNDLALGQLNAFSCSMPVCNNHLITGTVLDINGEKWVCITPACDLIPGQKSSMWESRIGQTHLVFKAIKFELAVLSTANEHANKNDYIYLNINGIPEAYWIGKDNPHWDTFYAENQGRYFEDNQLSLRCVREEESINGKTLTMINIQASAIAELRYEYALNLLHKFGSSQTRVGLDFQNKKSIW